MDLMSKYLLKFNVVRLHFVSKINHKLYKLMPTWQDKLFQDNLEYVSLLSFGINVMVTQVLIKLLV